MGLIDRIAEQSAEAPTVADVRKMDDFEQALKVTPKLTAEKINERISRPTPPAPPAEEPVLTQEKIDQRISRPADPGGPPKPYLGEGPVDKAASEAAVAKEAAAAREPMNMLMDRERSSAPVIAAQQAADAAAARAPMNEHMIAERATAPAQTAPVPEVPAPEPAPLPVEPVPAVAAQAEPAIVAEEPPRGDETALEGVKGEAGEKPTKKKQPSFGEKLKTLAQKIGVPLLHLLQAGAYGYAGIDRPTVLQRLQEQKAEREKTSEGRAYEEKIRKADREFATRMAEVQRQYEREASAARSAEDRQLAEYNAQQALARLREEMAGRERLAKIEAQTPGRGKVPTFDDLLK